MTIFLRTAVYLIAFGAILAIAVFCAETSFPEKTSAASTRNAIEPSTTEVVEETVTLSAGNTKLNSQVWKWADDNPVRAPLCSGDFNTIGPYEITDARPGTLTAGFAHRFWKRGWPCGPTRMLLVYRGTVWFDLSGIISKAPPLHVFVKSATLRFSRLQTDARDGNGRGVSLTCANELLYASDNWLKGWADNKLVPGYPVAKIESCGDCSFDVGSLVNNWVKGEEHGGEPNYGFLIRGLNEDYADDDGACFTQYGDFSLEVTYKYDKEKVPVNPVPEKPVIPVRNPAVIPPEVTALAPVNLALEKAATQISTYPSGEAYRAVDGNADGVWASGSVAATNSESQAWWQVDLGTIRSIQNIKVWNRVEAPERTSDFYVFVSDVPFTSTDLEATKTQVGSGRYFFTSGSCGRPTEIAVKKTGRYVRVQLSGTNYLQLAEVEVFAGPK